MNIRLINRKQTLMNRLYLVVRIHVLTFLSIILWSAAIADDTLNVSINGVKLGSTMEDVKLSFGAPIYEMELKGFAVGVEDYEYKLAYEGVDFYFINMRVEYMSLYSEKYQLRNGARIGQFMENSASVQLGSSDCSINYLVKNQLVDEIKVFCAN